jgi:uncharacterized protein YuzE
VRLIYDPKSDALTIRLRGALVHRSEEIDDGVTVLLDGEDAIVGFEVQNARKRLTLEELTSVTYENLSIGRRASLTLP